MEKRFSTNLLWREWTAGYYSTETNLNWGSMIRSSRTCGIKVLPQFYTRLNIYSSEKMK